MGNNQSRPSPRQKRTDSGSRIFDKKSKKSNNRLSKPKVGGENPNPIPISVSLSRRNSRASIQNCLPEPPARLNSLDGNSFVYQNQLSRAASVDLGRRNSLTGPGWNNHPTQKQSRETLHSPTPIGRPRSQTLDRALNSATPPSKSFSPVYGRPHTANTLDNIDLTNHHYQVQSDFEEPPPPTASSTASFHSALQSPIKRLTPSPTKLLNGVTQQQQQQQQQHSPQQQPVQPVNYVAELPSYHIPVRRRSLLQAAAPGTATRPKIEPEPELKPSYEEAIDSDEMPFISPSTLLAADENGVRPETPQDQGALGVFRRGSLYVTNGAPSPAPSSPSMRATSGTSQRPRDSSLLSLPPVSAMETSLGAAEKPEEPDTTTPTQTENFNIPRKPVGLNAVASPPSAKKAVVQLDTISPPPHLGLRLVPPSPDKQIPDFVETPGIAVRTSDLDEDSTDEDPHRRHLFSYSLRNKQFMNGQYQPSPSSDYSQGTTSAEPTAEASARPGMRRSPFSYEGSKLAQASNTLTIDIEATKRPRTAVEPRMLRTDTVDSMSEEVRPKPLIKRKSLPTQPVELPSEPVTQELSSQEPIAQENQNHLMASEDKLAASSNVSDTSEQTQSTKQGCLDSGYSSAGSSVLPPPPNDWSRYRNRQSAPEQIAQDFNRTYPQARPATSHNAQEGDITTSVLTVPYSSVRTRTPPAVEAPPKTPKSKKERQFMAMAMEKARLGEKANTVEDKENPIEVVNKSSPEKKKKKRRLSFKRLSFKSEKKPVVEAPPVDKREEPQDFYVDEPPESLPGFLPPLPVDSAPEPEETQYQLQPQPERRQSFTSSIRSGLQSIGYAPEAAALGTPEDELPSPFEPMAITSSTSSRGVQALRSSESVSYTGATYYQRFSTPSPGPGSISQLAAQNNTPERNSSFSKHATPPSSWRAPLRYSMDDQNRPSKPDFQQQIPRRPLGNSTIKNSQPMTHSSPNHSNRSGQTSRNNSFNSSYSYNAQNGFYQPSPQDRGRSSRSRHSVQSQPQSPVYNGVLPFATGNPHQQPQIRRQRSGSAGSVGPSGYPHHGQDYSSDQAMFGLDFSDVPVRRANDLLQNYGSAGPIGPYGQRQSYDSAAFYGSHNRDYDYDDDEEEEEIAKRKKESFWKRASIVGKGRSKSQIRGREVMGY